MTVSLSFTYSGSTAFDTDSRYLVSFRIQVGGQVFNIFVGESGRTLQNQRYNFLQRSFKTDGISEIIPRLALSCGQRVERITAIFLSKVGEAGSIPPSLPVFERLQPYFVDDSTLPEHLRHTAQIQMEECRHWKREEEELSNPSELLDEGSVQLHVTNDAGSLSATLMQPFARRARAYTLLRSPSCPRRRTTSL